jgi:hypothetical protein
LDWRGKEGWNGWNEEERNNGISVLVGCRAEGRGGGGARRREICWLGNRNGERKLGKRLGKVKGRRGRQEERRIEGWEDRRKSGKKDGSINTLSGGSEHILSPRTGERSKKAGNKEVKM